MRFRITTTQFVISLMTFASLPFERVASQSQVGQESVKKNIPMDSSRAPSALNLAAYNYLKSNYDSTTIYADSAYKLAKRVGQPTEMIKSLITKGVSSYYSGSHDQAMAFYLQALSLADSINDPISQASALNEMGVLNRKQGNVEKAEETFSRALALGKEAGDSSLIANSMNHLGVTYDLQEDYENAMSNFKASAEIKKRLNDTYGLTFNLDNMGQTSAKMGKYAEGEAFFLEAARLRKDLGDETGYAITINNIGELYLMKGEQRTALRYFEQALTAAEKLDFKDFRRHLHKITSDTYKSLGNYQLAYDHLARFATLNDSIFNEQKSRQILDMQTKYETEKKEQEIEIRDLKLAEQELLLNQKNLQLYSSVGGVGVLLILLYLAYNRLQLQKRVQLLEVHQKMQSERERISADLHDHVGAQLTSILSGLQITDQIDAFKNDENVVGIINSLKEDAQETLTSLRATIWSLHLSEIKAADFVDHIERHLASVLKYQNHLASEVHSYIDPDYTLGPREALNLTRTIQEAVQNVVKHANASKISISVTQKDKLTISIMDDGIGFNTGSVEKGEHYGLQNMKRRVEEIGGTMDILSNANAGTTLLISV